MGTDSPMSKRDDYTAYAAELLDLASRAASTSDKGRLLAIAEGLVELRSAIVVLRAPIPPLSGTPRLFPLWCAPTRRLQRRAHCSPFPDLRKGN